MLVTTFVLAVGLCQPAYAQNTFTRGGEVTCMTGPTYNMLTGKAWTILNGSAPGTTLTTKMISLDESVDYCKKGAHTSSTTCVDIQTLDGDKDATAVTWKEGTILNGFYTFRREHYHGSTKKGPDEYNGDQCDPPQPIACQGCSPIIVPISGGNQVKLSSAELGVFFDLNADGNLELVAWPEEPEKVGFLAFDRDGDGAITSGRELFGDSTFEGAPNGFQALTRLPRTQYVQSSLTAADAVFASLLLWFDRNRDGVSQPSELEPASDYVVAIGLNSFGVGKKDQHGNEFKFQGWTIFKEKPEEKRPIYDVFLQKQ